MSTPWSRYALLALFFFAASVPLARAEDPATLFATALAHEGAGRLAEARATYERLIALDPEHRAARRALGYEEVDGYWRKGDDLLRAKGFVHHDGRWMTATEFADATRPAREAEAQRDAERTVLGWLVRAARGDEEAGARIEGVPAALRLEPLAKALRCDPPAVRRLAAAALGRLGSPLAVPALLKRAIDDPEADVRRACAEALGSIRAPGTWVPLVRALGSRYADVRVRAAEAIATLGDVEAAPWVIARWEKRSGDFTRVYLATVRQISFIQDFDVEVASTSFIADPIVGVLQEGIVHDVRILATEQTGTTLERVAYHHALERLAGEDHGDDAAAWRRWWEAREPAR